ncbi:bifunctional phosphopantothenoylcysteine decarboxylase/phosphopantothenate--cysteine ligase CoaBC [Sessilibacter corallicola]|uniref:Coenzyme A biosynthesis bifunctional protein CoaBC n=1 Tax=Sessilibacter corallicola TaxID=2904075 RepID=A0ABQ0A618_9GAMM
MSQTRKLENKKILLGVTGGIAAYKAAELSRRLQDHGAEITVAMTKAAQTFVTPLTFQALTGNPVHTELLDPQAEAGMGHIELARWADLVLVVPASADFIARLVHGFGDDLLTTLCLARRAPLAVAPAMNQAMWTNKTTQNNIAKLAELDIKQFGPAQGDQACGDVGYGRLMEIPDIVNSVIDHFDDEAVDEPSQPSILSGKKVLLTAGPTREAIDPVRYITNHSSGKMGYALATAAAKAGAEVTLISGPTNLPDPKGVTTVRINTALEMQAAVMERVDESDVFIGSAAVADYRPASVAEQKIKKTQDKDDMTIELVKNPDIIAGVAGCTNKPFTVGFAAETNDVAQYAQSKLERKNLDMIVANDVSRKDIGFNSDQNEVTVFWPNGHQALPNLAKGTLAETLISLIEKRLSETTQ